jgi:hypothetical protein
MDSARSIAPTQPTFLPQLLALRPEALAQVEIARLNLLCADGLPGVAPINVSHTLFILDTSL